MIIRLTYSILSIVCAYVAYCYHSDIVKESSLFNDFSYVGTVATLIGLLITVFEVIHSVNISKSIQQEAKSLLKEVQLIESASSISDCLAAIDEVNKNVDIENYKSALKSFLYLRKICVKVVPTVMVDGNNQLSNLGQIEYVLHKATHTSPDARLSKKQKDDLIKKILLLKENFENMNPARRVS